MIVNVVAMILNVVANNEESEVLTSNCALWQKQTVWESIVVVDGIEVECVHSLSIVVVLQLIQDAIVEFSESHRIVNNILEVDRVSLDDIVAVLQLHNELIDFDEVVAVVVQLLLVANAWSQEDSKNAIGVLDRLNVNCNSELLGVQTTSASNNVDVVVGVSVPVVDLHALLEIIHHVVEVTIALDISVVVLHVSMMVVEFVSKMMGVIIIEVLVVFVSSELAILVSMLAFHVVEVVIFHRVRFA